MMLNGVVKVHHKFKKTGQMGSQEQVQKEESLELEPEQRQASARQTQSSLQANHTLTIAIDSIIINQCL